MNRGLLNRFYKGDCSQEEVKAVLKWFQDNNLSPQQEQELHAIWDEADIVKAEAEQAHDAGRIFNKIKAQLHEPQHTEQASSTIIRFIQPQQPQFWFKAAAAVLLPLCLLFAVLQYASNPFTETTAIYTSVMAAPGVQKTVHLPDGSVIRLNAGSEVSFLKDFDGDTREIQLQGEAFFEVAKDSLRPFIVHTGCISTQALGTSFNIDHNVFDATTTVALATGVVKIDKQEQGRKRQITQLVPGQQLSYNKASKQFMMGDFDRSEVLSWKEGVLRFKKSDMHQTIRKLENWYGVDIEVDTLHLQNEAWNYTGVYDNEALEKVLEGIGFVKDFTYKRTEDKVKIVFN